MTIKANTCPNCGEKLMPVYRLYFDSGPGKSTTCEQCGIDLIMDNGGVFYLLIMVIIGLAFPTFYVFTNYDLGTLPRWMFYTGILVYAFAWIQGTTISSWFLFGWRPVDDEE